MHIKYLDGCLVRAVLRRVSHVIATITGLSWWLRQSKICLQCKRPRFEVGKFPWKRAWQPTLVFLPGEIPWMEEPGRLQSIGLHRVGHN